MALPSTVEPETADSPKREALTIDEQEVQRAALAINATLQRQQGVTLLPTTLLEIVQVLTEYTPRVLRKRVGKSLTTSARSLLPLANASRSGDPDLSRQSTVDVREGVSTISDGCSTYTQQDITLNLLADTDVKLGGTNKTIGQHNSLPHVGELVDSRKDKSTTSDQCVVGLRASGKTNLLSGEDRERGGKDESTNLAPNLLTDGEIVNSSGSVFTEKITNKNRFSENIFSEHTGARERKTMQESTRSADNGQMVDSSRRYSPYQRWIIRSTQISA
jgi:hypothetical protein